MILFIEDNKLFIINKKVVHDYKCKSINKGFIINKDMFINEFLKIIKKEKIKLKMLGNDIKIVKNSYFKEADIYYLENILNELGFLKIEYIDIKDFFKDEATYIEVNNTYMIINLDEGLYLDLDYYKDIPKILNYFNVLLNKNIVFFGLNKNIPFIKVMNKDVFYMDNYQNYIPESLLKVEK